MVDHIDVSLLTHAAHAPSDLGVRISVVPRTVLQPNAPEGCVAVRSAVQTREIGPRFVGHVAMASHDELIVVGHVADAELQVWRGSTSNLTMFAEFAAPVPAGGLVALVRYLDTWHLFAHDERGRSSHLVSTDLGEWRQLHELASCFPAFAVSGVAVSDDGLLLAGRLFVEDTPFGWGLLRSDGSTFEARPVPLPLATQLSVIGPTVNRNGDTVLLLDSGHNRTVASSTERGWSLSLQMPGVSPTACFADGADLWVVGYDDTSGVPALANVNDVGIVHLPDSGFGQVRSALVHNDHLVLAREC
jgi:hypothetical protein